MDHPAGSTARINEEDLAHLRKDWARVLLFYLLAFFIGFSLLSNASGQENALQWGLIAGIVLTYQLIFLWRKLSENTHPASNRLLTTLGPGNWISVIRGLLVGVLSGFLLPAKPEGSMAWIPAVLYTSADLADYFDGYVARLTNTESRLGERLDIEWDALGLLIAVSISIRFGILPLWFLPFGLARYAYLATIWLARYIGRQIYPLPKSASRRPIAGLIMGFFTVPLWPIATRAAVTIAATVFAVPFLASFGRDWLVVLGWLDPLSRSYLEIRNKLKMVLLNWMPIILRLALGVILIPELMTNILARSEFSGSFSLFVGPAKETILTALLLIEGAALLLILIGFAARAGAFLLLFPLGLTIVGSAMTAPRAIALVCNLLILILGSGSLSLWKPEEALFRNRPGEKG
jgi:CDP-diacylglycerol--glycerol-3-phosphate 3-phosphatidyltransferase